MRLIELLVLHLPLYLLLDSGFNSIHSIKILDLIQDFNWLINFGLMVGIFHLNSFILWQSPYLYFLCLQRSIQRRAWGSFCRRFALSYHITVSLRVFLVHLHWFEELFVLGLLIRQFLVGLHRNGRFLKVISGGRYVFGYFLSFLDGVL